MLKRLRRGERSGQALAELAIALPVLALMIFGLIELGFIIKTRLVLQDAVRSAARYGSAAALQAGKPIALVAPLCQADYYALDVIADRLKNSLVDTGRVRAILIYRADANGGPIAAGTTGLSSNPTPPVGLTDIQGDYYYATYDPIDGKNRPLVSGSPDYGDLYTLFNTGASAVFQPSSPPLPFPALDPAHPPCGATLKPGAPTIYEDGASPGSTLVTVSNSLASAIHIADAGHGNWPPAFRNGSGLSYRDAANVDQTGNYINFGAPDHYGIKIVYDYEFHTPVFSVFANLLSRSHHFFRIVDTATFDLNPQ